MKVLYIVLLCAVAAVQGRSAAVKSSQADETDVNNERSVVHLRIAVATSGLLNSAVGSLISNNWVLTSNSAITDHRFIWVRLGALRVINPQIVLETNAVTTSTANSLALINLNRFVEATPLVSPTSLSASTGESGLLCAYGQENEVPGEILSCYNVDLSEDEGSIIVESSDVNIAPTNVGAPVFSGTAQTGLLVAADGTGRAEFVSVAEDIPWIQEVTGVNFSQ